MMTTSEVTQKQSRMEAFDNVVALYYVLKSNSMSLRVKQAIFRQDEVEAQPTDFIIDVELKASRLVGQRFYDMFLRTVYNESTDVLSKTLREALGQTFIEYGLTPEGAYRRLYYRVKNEQMRSYMKGTDNGTYRADDNLAECC